MTRLRKDDFVQVWNDANSAREVADYFGAKIGTVYSYAAKLRACGVEIKNFAAGPRSRDRLEKIVTMRKRGKTWREIGELLGVSPQAAEAQYTRHTLK